MQLKVLEQRVLQRTIVEAKMVKVIIKPWVDLCHWSLSRWVAYECLQDVIGTGVELSVATRSPKEALQKRRKEQLMGNANDRVPAGFNSR